jgi:hypothetical protein
MARCLRPPDGFWCPKEDGHSGPCPAYAYGDGATLIANERKRQVFAENYWPLDDVGRAAELAVAGSQYALAAWAQLNPAAPAHHTDPMDWPWAPGYWKVPPKPVHTLIKAGGLIAASIDDIINTEGWA